jgi:hypothetical protein
VTGLWGDMCHDAALWVTLVTCALRHYML